MLDMTEATPITILKSCLEEAGFVSSIPLISDLGLSLGRDPDVNQGVHYSELFQIPERVFVLHNSYAFVVGYAALHEECTKESLWLEIKERMHTFIRKVLSNLEDKRGLIIDGYLLIALPVEPDEKVKIAVRDVELDTKVCRKHVVWPSVNKVDLLDRMEFITILNLPKPLSYNTENTASYELSPPASKVISMYKKSGSLDKLLEAIKNGDLADAD